MSLELLTGFAGASILTGLLVQAFKMAVVTPGSKTERFLPFIAMGIGIAVVVFATVMLGLVTRLDIGNAIITGIFAGLAAVGMYETVKGATNS